MKEKEIDRYTRLSGCINVLFDLGLCLRIDDKRVSIDVFVHYEDNRFLNDFKVSDSDC